MTGATQIYTDAKIKVPVGGHRDHRSVPYYQKVGQRLQTAVILGVHENEMLGVAQSSRKCCSLLSIRM